MTYGGEYGSSVEMEPLSDWSRDGNAAHFRIGDTGIGIFLVLPRASALLC